MNAINPVIEPIQGELNFLSMNCSFLEQAGIAACGRQFVQQVLLFLQNGEIKFAALTIVKAVDDVAFLARKLKSGVSLRGRGGGFAKFFSAFVATRFEHHARMLVLEHLTRRKAM